MYKLMCITTCVKTYFLPSLHRQYYYSGIMPVDYVSTWRFTLRHLLKIAPRNWHAIIILTLIADNASLYHRSLVSTGRFYLDCEAASRTFRAVKTHVVVAYKRLARLFVHIMRNDMWNRIVWKDKSPGLKERIYNILMYTHSSTTYDFHECAKNNINLYLQNIDVSQDS